ncbi:multiheme c-type cytochrome [Sandaracinus amylolyticus]|nr:multiheme c-type cytochrome [Sandaracinus amylolyticus]
MSIASGSRRAMLVGLVSLIALTLAGASCSGGARETTPSAPEVAEARLPRTDLRLLVVTDMMGYLEPCGCTSRPLGGIDRLAAAVRAQRSGDVPTLFLAAGDLFFDGTSHGVEAAEAATQEIWKAETIADVLGGLQLAAAVPGPLDLRFGARTFDALAERASFPLLAAGVQIARDAADPSTPAAAPRALQSRVVREVGGVRVGIVGLSEMTDVAGVIASETDLMEAARREVAAVRSEGAQLVVVLARAQRRTVRRIASDVEGIDFVVQGGLDTAEPHLPADTGAATILHASHHGQGLLVVDLARGERGVWMDASTWTRTAERDRLRAEADTLRARIGEWERDPNVSEADVVQQRARLAELEERIRAVTRAPEVVTPAFAARFVELAPEAERDATTTGVLDRYFRRVNEHNREAFASLVPRPAPEGQPSYVGTQACGSCHAEELAWWRTTMHGQAYRTLQERHKEYNLSCVGCHVTGYNQPGGSTVAHVGPLQDVGCENCHGPGSQHVADPQGALVNVRLDAPEEVCVRCHNTEHSDRFHYPTYRRMMMAPGHGMPSAPAQGAAAEGS